MNEFFRDRVEILPIAGCWIWTRALAKSGYGSFRANRKTQHAHRASWAAHRTPWELDKRNPENRL